MAPTYHHALSPGTVIESYEVSRVLGVGGFGVTYRAFDRTLQRDVAMKEYLPTGLAIRTPDGTTVSPKSDNDLANYEYGLKRFLDEARTLAKFREPNIVRVIRYLEAHGTAYFIMDYEDGESLSGRLKRVGTMAEDVISAIMFPILGSLKAVHEQGFLHRDIKPGNIYIRKDGSPVLLDFGAARQALGEQSRAMTGMVTPGYAPFEQYFSSGKQGPWSDMYGIGATIYHCMAGFAPVASTERIAAIQDGERDPLGKITKLVTRQYSERFLQAVISMLAPNAKDRPQTVDEALAAFGSDGPRAAVSPAADERPSTEFPETQHIDQLADSQATWQPGVLNTVELNLEQHIGPLSKALVRKASKKAANMEELIELLSRFIPSEKAKTVFLAKTQIIGETEILPVATEPVDAILKPQMPADISELSQPSIRSRPGIRSRPSIPSKPTAPSAPSTPSQPVSAIDKAALRLAEESLAVHVGPMARILVKKAAKRTSDLKEFYTILAKELPAEEQRDAFRNAVGKSAWR